MSPDHPPRRPFSDKDADTGAMRCTRFENDRKEHLDTRSSDPMIPSTACGAFQAKREAPSSSTKSRMGSPTFRQWAHDTWWPRSSPRFRRETVMAYRSMLDSELIPAFGDTRLDGIGRATVLSWFERYSRVAPIRANEALKLLGSILDRAVRAGIIRINPVRRIRYNPKQRRTRFLSVEERKRLLSTLDTLPRGQRIRGLVLKMLLFTGCRSSEIRTLQWNEVEDASLNLADGKTGGRRVWLGERALAVIAEARDMRDASGIHCEYVFPDPRNPLQCMGRCSISDFWRGLRKQIGIGDVRVHDLRHSFATEAVRQGVALPVVSRLLGHSKIEMTMRYTHSTDAETEAAAELVGQRLAALLRGSVSQRC